MVKEREVRELYAEMASAKRRSHLALGLGFAALLFGGLTTAGAFELGTPATDRQINGLPAVIPFQGVYEEGGQPFDGQVNMSFALYGQDSGGAPLWASTSRSISVEDGSFAVALGASDDSTPIPPEVFAQSSLYIELSVAGAPLTPRQRIAPAPQAMAAAVAADNFTVPGNLDVGGSSNFSGDISGLANGITLLPPTTLSNNSSATPSNTPVPIAPNDGKHFCSLTGVTYDKANGSATVHLGSCVVVAGANDWTIEYNSINGVLVGCKAQCIRFD